MTFQLSTKPFVGAQKMHIPCDISNCFRLEDTLRDRTKHPCRIPGLRNDGCCKTVERFPRFVQFHTNPPPTLRFIHSRLPTLLPPYPRPSPTLTGYGSPNNVPFSVFQPVYTCIIAKGMQSVI